MNKDFQQQLEEAVLYLTDQKIDQPEVGIVLGTGLGKLVEHIDIEKEIEYTNIPNFPVSTVESHHGKLIYGHCGNKKVLAMQGRFHYYEGYTLQQATLPIRVMKMLGIRELLLSNAAGAMNLNYKKGELMLLDDHINMLPDNPLRGPNLDKMGPRFPDMSVPYSRTMNDKFESLAGQLHITLHKGCYVAVTGPNLETRAEYRYLRNFADVVGMSTVPEVIVANHIGLPCAAISVLTDECDPDNLHPVSLQEILKIAGEAEKDLTRLFVEYLKGN
ncbi:MAG: purine-nucleoside phosphorylase [Bacteroidetes bacterium]|jgi:purine-nucleoside phosphorylase|nr:purine-nucleoside phosphorylase [Bacteroidota bacterium]